MAVDYNIGKSIVDFKSRVSEWEIARGVPANYRITNPLTGRHIFSVPDSNFEFTNMHVEAQSGIWSTVWKMFTDKARLTEITGRRACVMRVPCIDYRNWADSGNDTYYYIPLANHTNPLSCSTARPSVSTVTSNMKIMGLDNQWANDNVDGYNSVFSTYTTSQRDYVSNLIRPRNTSLFTSYFNSLNGRVTNFCIPSGVWCCGFPIYNYGVNSRFIHVFSFDSIPLKVFEWGDVDGVVKYLNDGDDSGAIDPFDPNNPSVVTVTDLKTNFDAYVTLGDPAQPYSGFTNIHWSVRALNEQYNEARDILAGMYRLSVYNTPIRRQGESATGIEYKTTYAQVPVASFTAPIPNLDTSHNVIQFYFGDSSYDLLAPELVGNTSGFFLIDYHYKKGSRSKCKIDKVKFNSARFSPDWENEGVELSRVNIGTDAYKYTASTGETLTIYFRGITLEDLNKTDDGYKENPDTEASPTDSDMSVVSGSGLSTFSISKEQFNLINKALWSTDWTQVFKSTTIDPIKCVITCKGIKFANGGTGEVPIIIANRDTGVLSGVVNPVKSYTIDNCYIPAIKGDFTDISLMRVRCYLPYIGWVDLPSAEVVGRLAYNGVPAVNKRLTFKYIVDFIDGACRCIVSVNGTERWMFDGNCAVDIPVTSDNHTNAIGTAIKAGLATTLSIATGVAGAISGNAGAVAGGVVGAVNNAPNMLPTYEYSASASPSGYVNGSCNSHIMIVCEVPNVQIPNGFARKVGRPCERNLSLGSLVGYTQCKNANVSGINATTEELTMIAQELNSGVYL